MEIPVRPRMNEMTQPQLQKDPLLRAKNKSTRISDLGIGSNAHNLIM